MWTRSMRNLLPFIAAALVAGCAATPAPSAAGGGCNAEPGQAFVGQQVSEEVGRKILAATGARVLRWAAPDMMMTMEFSPERVTVHYGTDKRIGQVVCG